MTVAKKQDGYTNDILNLQLPPKFFVKCPPTEEEDLGGVEKGAAP
jgi:hypothetical protein